MYRRCSGLSEMVETAVRLAQATESLPERLKMKQASGAAKEADVLEDQDLAGQVLEDAVLEEPASDDPVLEDSVLETPTPVIPVTAEKKSQASAVPADKVSAELAKPVAVPEAVGTRQSAVLSRVDAKVAGSSTDSGQAPAQKTNVPEATPVAKTAAAVPPRKTLFWSAALNPAAEAGKAEETDQSHVPPVLRSLRKCEACGFPVSAGRVLCVECEEKKWRGQLNVPKAAPLVPVAAVPVKTTAPAAKPEARAFAAAVQSVVASASAPTAVAPSVEISPRVKDSGVKESKEAAPPVVAAPVLSSSVPEVAETPEVPDAAPAEFVLSAGLAPSQSWIARNKYVLGVLLVVGAAVATIFILR